MQKEIEIKFKIEKEDNVEQKLLSLGGIAKKPYRQTTYGFFSKDSVQKGIFPRIRDEKGNIVLTVKIKPKKKSNYFERKEYSIKIMKTKDGINILKALGFDKVRIFKKTRQEWKFQDAELSLDKLYFGTFLEIEGSKKAIEDMVVKLNFQARQRITKAYLALEDDYKNYQI